MFIDTHCHLDFASVRAELPAILQRARSAGVGRMVVPGVTPEGWVGIKSLADSDSRIMPAFGVHPMLAQKADEEALELLSSCLDGAVAVGEIGLDYSVREPSRQVQQEAFRRQVRMAVERELPLLVHCRGGFADLLRIMGEERVSRVGGIMHAFSGSPEIARECISLGFYISVCGTVTYHNAVRPLRVARELPLDQLVLETDAPDLSPEPFRGRPNEPAFMLETARALAELKGLPLERVAETTTANALKILKIKIDLDGDE